MKESEATTTQSTNKMGSSLDKFGSKIIAAFSVAAITDFVTRAASQLFAFSANVDKSMREVSTISQAVANDMEGYKRAILDMTGSIPISADEAAKALYQIVSAGYDGAEALSVLEVSARAAVGGVTDVATAADAITTLLNSYKVGATKANNVSDMLFTTVKLGKTTMGELGQSIAQVAPIAASFGIEMDQVLAAVATLTKSGTPTAEAMTQIRASIITATKVLGDGYFATHTFQEGLAEIAAKSGGSESELRKLVPEVEALNAVLGLTGINAVTASDDLQSLANSAGAASAAFKEIVDYSEQFQMLGSNILALFSGVSSGVLSKLGLVAESTNKMFKFKTFDAKFAYILNDALDDFSNGLDHTINTSNSAKEAIEILTKQFADLNDTYQSFDKGNPFMFEPAKITTNIGTEFEITTTGDDAVGIYKTTAEKMNLLATKIKELQSQGDETLIDGIGDIAKGLQSVSDAVDPNTINGIQSQINALRKLANVEPNTDKLREYGAQIVALTTQLNSLTQIRDTGVVKLDIKPILGEVDTTEISEGLDRALSAMVAPIITPIVIPPLDIAEFEKSVKKMEKSAKEAQKAAKKTEEEEDEVEKSNTALASAIATFSSAIGESFADGQIDGDELKAMFVSPLAEAAQQFGSLLIAQGAAIQALGSCNPAIMIAGGAALVALGAALSASLKDVTHSVGSSSSGPTVDTFTGGYSVGTPKDLDFSTRSIEVTGDFRLDGNNLVASINKTNNYNGR